MSCSAYAAISRERRPPPFRIITGLAAPPVDCSGLLADYFLSNHSAAGE
jgi:hypothetical protein